jgi:uncharacterized protein (TIGR00297 family)
MVLVLAMLKVDCKSMDGMRLRESKEMQGVDEDTGWSKAISWGRDRLQSRVLVGFVVPLLVVGLAAAYRPLTIMSAVPLLCSLAFAIVVWLLRSATVPAAGVGFLICAILARTPTVSAGFPPPDAYRPAIPALIVLFVFTFAATRFGRKRKEQRGLAESKSGRRASQIVANLGIAALCALIGWYVGCIAALAEATADTVSSEVGQALGGTTWMITTLRRVPSGRDGGVSLMGTVAGIAAAGVVVMAGSLHHALWPDEALVLVAACGGLLFDSLLGATVERRGWLGNDLVNFLSTLFAAGLPYLWLLARGRATLQL